MTEWNFRDLAAERRTRPGPDLLTALLEAEERGDRDPAHFPDPDRLDLARRDNRHVASGRGIHFCLGAPLARLEGRIALEALARCHPTMRLATDAPAWRPSVTLRGLETLPVAL